MPRIGIRFGVIGTIALLLGGTTVLAIKSPEALRERERRRHLEQIGAYERARKVMDARAVPPADHPAQRLVRQPSLSVVDDGQRGASLLSVLDTDTIPSPGVVAGITSYDFQHNEGQGHQVARNPGAEVVHMSWMYWDRIPTDIEEQDRFVRYNSYDVASGQFNQGFDGCAISLGDIARAGYTRLDVDRGNTAHVVFHQRTDIGFPYSSWHLAFPLEGSCLHMDEELHSGTLGEILWADVAISQNAGSKSTGDVRHVIAHDGNLQTRNLITYWRYDEGAAAPAWEGPAIIDSNVIVGQVIDGDDRSDRVAIAYHSSWLEDGHNGVRNVAYRESATEGAGWIDGSELGPQTKNLISSYSDPEGAEAWVHISVAYDHASTLHIVWDEQRIRGVSEEIAIRHWNSVRGTMRPVVFGYYENPGVQFFNLNLTKITLGIGDGATPCQGGAQTNENYLYVVYTKMCGETEEERDDLSAQGFCNGELYLAVSNSGGNTWSPPLNLTNTKFPGCTPVHPDSVCPSEHWATIGRDVSDIDIFYIRDFDAGGVPFEEGVWTINRAMYLRLPGGTTDAEYVCPVIAPSFVSFLTADPECEYHAAPGMTNTETLTMFNLGNADMVGEISVTQGAEWLSVDGAGPYTLPAGQDEVAMTVTMGPRTVEDLYVGNIRVTHNDTTKTDPVDYPVAFFVIDGFKCPQQNTLRTGVASPGVLTLEMGSGGRFASQTETGGLWRYLDSSSTIYDATLLVAHGDQSLDTIVYHRFGEREDPGQRGFRALTDLVLDTTAYGTGAGYAKASADLTTIDSTVGIRMEWFFPQDPVYADFVIVKYTVSNRTASPLADVLVGLWLDLDVLSAGYLADLQDGVGNHGYYEAAQNLVFQYGYDTVGHIPIDHLNSTERYAGGMSYVSGRDAAGETFSHAAAPMRGGVDDNRLNQDGGPTSALLYRTLVGGPGVGIWEPSPHGDSSKDQFTWVLLDQGRTLAADGANPETYIVALVSDTLQNPAYTVTAKSMAGGLAEVVDSAWAWAERYVGCVCSNHGDPWADGVTNVLDVVQVVNVAFRGFPPVFDDDCPYERSDVDCSGFTNVMDVVFTVNVAFRGFDPSAQFCDGCAD
ncbi:MAG TPA: hypothetical protein VM118_00680 [Acidobacteriota bacterium]|nr:hypothetical protein [Acidobacteriota bacterium]